MKLFALVNLKDNPTDFKSLIWCRNCKKIAEAKEADNHAEVMQKAAEELGWQIPVEELERRYAASKELNEEELERVDGDSIDALKKKSLYSLQF